MSEPVTGTTAPTSEAVNSTPTTENQVLNGQVTASPDQVADLQDQAANGTPKEQAAAKKMLKKLSYKVDGQEFSEELPFEIPEEHKEYMSKQLSLNKGAQKRMQEKAQLENEVKAFFEQFKKDPKSGMSKLGMDPKQFAAAMLEEELRQSQLTPEQREREELLAKVKEMEDTRKKEKEDFDKKELARLEQVEYERISNKIEKAIDTSGLPKDPSIVKRIANYMLIGNQMNVKFEPEELVEIVRDDMMRDMQAIIKILGPDKMEQVIGKDILTQIRKKNVAKAKQTPATAKSAIKDVGAEKVKEPKQEEKKNFKQFFGF